MPRNEFIKIWGGAEVDLQLVCETGFILLFIIILFSIRTTVNLHLPHPDFIGPVH